MTAPPRYSAASLVRQGLRHHDWPRVWRNVELEPAYDVVIIGAGVHGLATAYYLAARHGITRVAVLDKGYVGGGGSGRNTAIIRANYLTPEAEADLQARAEGDGVEFFFAMFVDMHGKPCAKMVPVEALDVLLGGGAGFAGFAAGPMGQTPADPDLIAVPDPASYTLVLWQPGLAVLQCDVHVGGEPWPYSPRVILLVHSVAHEAGLTATFTPKPFSNLTGNGLHLHSSLWDKSTGAELFSDPGDARGLGLSAMAYHYIAGLIDHARALVAVTCPIVNSYKRMGVGAPTSGATWAHAYATYGGNNRTQMLRVPEGGRVENRACDGAANPYLAMAAQLAAGLDGVDRALDPGEPNQENLYDLSPEQVAARGIKAMPPTLLHAVDELVEDEVLRSALGKTRDGDYVDYYAKVRREEFRSWHAEVTDRELQRYLTLF